MAPRRAGTWLLLAATLRALGAAAHDATEAQAGAATQLEANVHWVRPETGHIAWGIGRAYVSSDSEPGQQVISYRITSLIRGGLGLHVLRGGSCKDTTTWGPRLWNSSTNAHDPWADLAIPFDIRGLMQGTSHVTTGLALQDLSRALLVLTNREGEPYGCGRLHDMKTSQTPCYTEDEWRAQSMLNFSGAFERCGPELICPQGHRICEDFCMLDDECERYPLRVCDGTTQKCRHKFVFEAVPGVDVGVAFLFLFISGMALSAGIGGGGLYVPLLMLVLGFSVREATALSQACLAGGATTNLLYTMRQQHPSQPKPAIDYDLVLVMGPNLLIGALLGSALNASAPSWLILTLLLVILVLAAYEALKKARALWRAEQEQARHGVRPGAARLANNPIERLLSCCCRRRYAPFEDCQMGHPDKPPDRVIGAAGHCEGHCYAVALPVALRDASPEAKQWRPCGAVPMTSPGADCLQECNHRRELDSEFVDVELDDKSVDGESRDTSSDVVASQESMRQPQFPKGKLLLLAGMWLVTVASVFARGGRAAEGLVPYCSVGYWLLALLTAAVLAALAFLGAWRAVRKQQTQGLCLNSVVLSPKVCGSEASDSAADGELNWTPSLARKIALGSLLAGTFAALCGIGGGMVMGPILLRLGFPPKVQSATTGTTLFVVSTSTALAFLVQGIAPKGYALFLAASTGIGALSGKAVVGWLVKRSGHESLLSFILGGIIALSVIVMGITGSIDVANDIREGTDMLFQGFCSASEY